MALCKAEETLPQALTGFDFGGEIVGAVRYGNAALCHGILFGVRRILYPPAIIHDH